MEKTVLEPIDPSVKVGDKVFCTNYGNGIIKRIDSNDYHFPYIVEFQLEKPTTITYTKDGRRFFQAIISLFKGHYQNIEITGEKIAD